jgi:bifunctional aspartate aminotransferase and glutamate/aspartate-prephenate aminotransferase
MASCQATAEIPAVDMTLNPALSKVKPSKTMALTDLARSMRESGIDVRHC